MSGKERVLRKDELMCRNKKGGTSISSVPAVCYLGGDRKSHPHRKKGIVSNFYEPMTSEF